MKKLLLFGGIALISLCAAAQSFSNPKVLPMDVESFYYVIPQELSFNGTDRVVIPTDWGTGLITLYSNDFEEIKQINIGSSVEYVPTTVTQKEVVSVQYREEDYTIEEDASFGGGYITFDSEPTNDEVFTALQANGYPNAELFTCNGEDYFVLEKKNVYFESYNPESGYWSTINEDNEMIVAAKEAGLLVEDRKIYNFSYNGSEMAVAFATIPSRLVKAAEYYDENEDIYKYALMTYGWSIYSIQEDNSYITFGAYVEDEGDYYLERSFSTYTDDEIVALLNSARLNYYFYNAKQVEAVTTDIKGNKWFVCLQEKVGDIVLNKYGFALIGGYLYVAGFDGNAEITYGDKEEVVYRSTIKTENISGEATYTNYDNSVGAPSNVFLSQTFFNKDAQYEYFTFHTVVKKYLTKTFTNGYNAYDPNTHEYTKIAGEGKVYTEKVMYDGLNVVSENGTILETVMFPDNFLSTSYGCYFFILGGSKYIAVHGYLNYEYEADYEDQEYATLLYKVNDSNNGTQLSPVSAPIRVSVRPTMLNENESVTVTLDEETTSDKQVRIVDMNGRVMNKSRIPAGQKSTQVKHLPKGMNMVQVMDGDNSIHVQRVIVK